MSETRKARKKSGNASKIASLFHFPTWFDFVPSIRSKIVLAVEC